MKKRKSYHIIPTSNGGWTVKSSSSKASMGTFKTQKQAISHAKHEAKKEEGILYVHDKNGYIRESHNFGKDIYPPRDYRPMGEAKGKIKVSEDFDEEYVSNGR